MEEKFYRVCELEDKVQSFVELSVAAVPDIWIVKMIDGSNFCYWPMEDATMKIRTFANPNEGGKWKSYKCRILMNGAKYSRYEEAREAEIDAQNLSNHLDSTEALNSTMNFSVSDDHGDIKKSCNEKFDNDGFRLNSTMDFDVADDVADNGEVIGNDSFNFNKAALLIPHYASNNLMSKTVGFGQDDQCDSDDSLKSKPGENLLERYASMSCRSDESDYNNRFGINNDFLTSTVDSRVSIDSESNTILSHIMTLEANILSFYEDIKKDLRDIKESLCTKVGPLMKDQDLTQQNAMLICPSNQGIDDDNMMVCPSNQGVDGENLDHVSGDNISNIHAWLENDIIFEPSPPSPTSIHPDENLSAALMNGTFSVYQPLEMEPAAEVEFDENKNQGAPVPDAPDHDSFDLNLPAELKMKISDKDEFAGNEDLLKLEEEMEKEMVERLSPLHQETEAAYMNRIVDLLFAENFFLDEITWKVGEKNRQCIKKSNTLKCWKAKYEPLFGRDEKNKKFMAHFRRIKSAKRAANKAALNGAPPPKQKLKRTLKRTLKSAKMK